MTVWQRRAALTVHILLYVLLFALPLTGWMYNSLAGFPLRWFDLVHVPALHDSNDALKGLVRDLHETLAWVLVTLVALHAAAALKHHFLDRDQALASGDWFDVAHQPTATFRTVAMRMTARGPTADADLAIKGKTQRIAFPFRFAVTGSDATLDAHVTIDRLDYGLGAGEWADESVVGRKVEVTTHLVLHAAPAK